MKISIDAATRGDLIGKPINKVRKLLEDMASNNYYQASDRGNPKKGERLDVDAFIMLATKVYALL